MTYKKIKYIFKRWYCLDCLEYFEEPEYVTRKNHYVVGDMDKYKIEDCIVCPLCGSEHIYEAYDEMESEEF